MIDIISPTVSMLSVKIKNFSLLIIRSFITKSHPIVQNETYYI